MSVIEIAQRWIVGILAMTFVIWGFTTADLAQAAEIPSCPPGQEAIPNGEDDGAGYQCGDADEACPDNPGCGVIGVPEFPDTQLPPLEPYVYTPPLVEELPNTGSADDEFRLLVGVAALILIVCGVVALAAKRSKP